MPCLISMTSAFSFSYIRIGMISAVLALSGCAAYHALPLARQPNLEHAPARGTAATPEASTQAAPALDLASVARLALRNDPALAAARARVKVAKAQAYDAGLLPDPTVGLSLAHPFNGGAPSDHHNPWSIGLTENLIGLITHGDKHSAASAHYAATLLSWRWQAEQVALKAQATYLDVWADREVIASLRSEAKAARQTLSAAGKARSEGALSAALYQQAQQQYSSILLRLRKTSDRALQARGTLATLLRMNSDAPLKLSPPATVQTPAAGTVSNAIERLPRHRLDLLALQAGYRSADARLRADILAQFPILDIGFTRSRDNTGVNSFGFGITLRLPIFNGNRGKIAVDRATRKSLNAAYQAHLDSAANNARTAWRRLQLATRELDELKTQLPGLAHAARASDTALARGDMTRFQALSARTAWLDARINVVQLRAEAGKLALTLRMLLALPPGTPRPEGTST